MGLLGKLLVAKEAKKIQNQNSKDFQTSFPFLLSAILASSLSRMTAAQLLHAV
jgi:hypothetical protein